MRVKCFGAMAASFLLCCTGGCHLGGAGASGCGPGGCASLGAAGCNSGSCGGLVGLLPKMGYGACGDGGCVTPETLTQDGFGSRGGYVGPLAGHIGKHHRGPQSHMGPYPGPAAGPPSGTVAYPYYTTRGPRDFFLDDPASIGP